MKKTIGLLEILTILKRNGTALMISGLVFAGGAFLVSNYLMEPQYSATTNLLVSQNVTTTQAMQLGAIETNLRMIQTYRDVIQDSIIMEDTVAALNNRYTSEEISSKVTVDIQPDSQVFAVTAVDSHPEIAALITNKTAQ